MVIVPGVEDVAAVKAETVPQMFRVEAAVLDEVEKLPLTICPAPLVDAVRQTGAPLAAAPVPAPVVPTGVVKIDPPARVVPTAMGKVRPPMVMVPAVVGVAGV